MKIPEDKEELVEFAADRLGDAWLVLRRVWKLKAHKKDVERAMSVLEGLICGLEAARLGLERGKLQCDPEYEQWKNVGWRIAKSLLNK
jgi:hypothetical protein